MARKLKMGAGNADKLFEGKHYIGGKWHEHIDKLNYLENKNPATGKTLGVIPCKNGGEFVNTAAIIAKKSFPKWNDLGMIKRAEHLWRVARLIEDNKDKLARIVCLESGKQINEAYADVVEGLHMAQFGFSVGHFGKRGEVFDDEIGTKLCLSITEPRGVVAAITPWNFPFAIPFWLVALPLIYGNTVILKPSEETPWSAQKIAEFFHRAEIPPGVFQLIHGMGEDAGWSLATHSGINTILFTGSYDVGSKIKKEVAKHHHKNCAIETGSKSGLVVLEDADIDMAVEAGVASAFKTAGQRCVSGSRMIVVKKVYREFTEKFVKKATLIKVGDPFNHNTFYGPMINREAKEKGEYYNKLAREEGFEILLDRNNEEQPTKEGHWLMPFVYTGKWRKNSRCLTEEAFSPHVAIIPAEDREDAIRIYNDTDYGLSGSVITKDISKAIVSILELVCGITYVNLPCIGAGVRLPFGGRGKSGNLVESAAGLVPAITHKKAVTINFGEEIVMAQGLKIKS